MNRFGHQVIGSQASSIARKRHQDPHAYVSRLRSILHGPHDDVGGGKLKKGVHVCRVPRSYIQPARSLRSPATSPAQYRKEAVRAVLDFWPVHAAAHLGSISWFPVVDAQSPLDHGMAHGFHLSGDERRSGSRNPDRVHAATNARPFCGGAWRRSACMTGQWASTGSRSVETEVRRKRLQWPARRRRSTSTLVPERTDLPRSCTRAAPRRQSHSVAGATSFDTPGHRERVEAGGHKQRACLGDRPHDLAGSDRLGTDFRYREDTAAAHLHSRSRRLRLDSLTAARTLPSASLRR